MSNASRADDVVSLADYLRGVLHEADETLGHIAALRDSLAFRIHLLEQAESADVDHAVADYEQRIQSDWAYEESMDHAEVVSLGHKFL